MKTFSADGIILKRINFGEADRLLTVYTRELGKIVCLARGIRKMTSTKRSALEPGFRAKLFFHEKDGYRTLIQAVLLREYGSIGRDLVTVRRIAQILEIVDSITIEEEGQEEVYDEVIHILELIAEREVHIAQQVRRSLYRILQLLGLTPERISKERSVTAFIEELSNKKLRSYRFLSV